MIYERGVEALHVLLSLRLAKAAGLNFYDKHIFLKLNAIIIFCVDLLFPFLDLSICT